MLRRDARYLAHKDAAFEAERLSVENTGKEMSSHEQVES